MKRDWMRRREMQIDALDSPPRPTSRRARGGYLWVWFLTRSRKAVFRTEKRRHAHGRAERSEGPEAGCTRGRPISVTNYSFGLFADSVHLLLARRPPSASDTYIVARLTSRGVQQSWSDAERATQWRERGAPSPDWSAQPMSRAPRVRAPDALLMMQSAQLRPWLSMEPWQ